MGGVVFGKRRREKEKRGEMLSISSPVFYPTFRTTAYVFPLTDSIVGKGQRMSPESDEQKRFDLCACRLFRNAALRLCPARRERRVEVRGG